MERRVADMRKPSAQMHLFQIGAIVKSLMANVRRPVRDRDTAQPANAEKREIPNPFNRRWDQD